MLGAQDDVSEFGVRDEHAVVNQGGADAGAQCGGDDQTILALGGTELDFGQAGGVGVVYHDDRAAAGFGEHFSNVHANPRLVKVGHEVELLAGLDRRGESDANGCGFRHFEVVELLLDDFGHGLRRGDLGSENLQSRLGEIALGQIDRCGLDAGTANVNTESLCSFNHR